MTLMIPRSLAETGTLDTAPGTEVQDWEALLPERDRDRLEALRRAGAEVIWSHKALDRGDGGQIVHHLVEVRQMQLGQRPGRVRLGQAGPTDFRYGHREQLVQKMMRSVLGQALAALNLDLA